jgi:hypothetical protein
LCWIFNQIHAHLVFLRDSNCELSHPSNTLPRLPLFRPLSMVQLA